MKIKAKIPNKNTTKMNPEVFQKDNPKTKKGTSHNSKDGEH